jgi:hypothetical protein
LAPLYLVGLIMSMVGLCHARGIGSAQSPGAPVGATKEEAPPPRLAAGVAERDPQQRLLLEATATTCEAGAAAQPATELARRGRMGTLLLGALLAVLCGCFSALQA